MIGVARLRTAVPLERLPVPKTKDPRVKETSVTPEPPWMET